jgi:hydrogenase expression/formation protein HypC
VRVTKKKPAFVDMVSKLSLHLGLYVKKKRSMCLAIPGKIVALDCSIPELRMAVVDFGGICKQICVQWVEAIVGDYVLAHAGMAIAAVDPVEAEKTLKEFEIMACSISNDV